MSFKKNIYTLLVYRITILFVIYSIFRILFYAFNLNAFSDIEPGHLTTLLFAGLKFDMSAIFYINSLYIVAQIIPLNFRYNVTYQKTLKFLYCVTNSLFFFFNCADFAYFRFLTRRTTFSVFREFSNDVQNINLVWQLVSDYWWVLAIWIISTVLLIVIYGTTRPEKPISKKSTYIKQTLAMLLILGVVVIGMRGNLNNQPPIDINHASLKVKSPIESNIVLNTSFTLIRAYKQKSINKIEYFTENEIDEIYCPIHYPKSEGEFKNKNVFIIILEGIGKAHMGYSKKFDSTYTGYTPFLDSLITKSLAFEYSFANGYTSMNAIPSILASMPTFLQNDNYTTSIYANNKLEGLGDLLSAKGYETSFFHGADNGSMRFLEFTQQIGIKNYYGRTEYNNEADYDGTWGIFDEPFLQFTAQKVSEQKEPFLSAVFTVTSHAPWPIPKKYENKFPKGDIEMHEVTGYTDYALKQFFETAEKMPWFKNTLFVISADHTSPTNYKKYNNSYGKVCIPIFLYDPSGEIKPKEDIGRIMQQIDIMPSILDYLNYDKPYFSFGKSIFDTIVKQFSMGIVNGTHQLIYDDYLIHVNNGQPNALYKYKEDILLENNLLENNLLEKSESIDDAFRFYKAFIQQYNNRLIENKTVFKE